MNTSSLVAGVFLAVSLIILICLFAVKFPNPVKKFIGFYRACCGVYVSGNLLVLVFTLLMNKLPVAFVFISDGTVFFVFCLTVCFIYFLTKTIVEKSSTSNAEDIKKDDEK